jgi:benzoyl-CoA reductase/2-hydroxyglutaryl-CoA dehydratase subunit BcrC/BadD/HgdB
MPDVPIYNIDLPYPLFDPNRDHREVIGYYHKYIVKELKGFIAFLEKQTGKKMDYDRLWGFVKLSDKTWDLIEETYDLRAAHPCPMGTGDAMNTMVPMSFKMASQEAYDFFLNLKAELEEKIAKKEGVVENERFRLLWGGGLPSWFALSDFNYFNSKGAVFPAETTYRMVAPIDQMDIPETKDPVEHLAWRWLGFWTFWYDKARQRPGSEPDVERLINYIERYDIDGVVMHEAFSCRTWHVGLIWQLQQLAKVYKPIPVLHLGGNGKKEKTNKELPSLILESDIIDITSYSEVDTRNKIDAFIETLESVAKSKAKDQRQ